MNRPAASLLVALLASLPCGCSRSFVHGLVLEDGGTSDGVGDPDGGTWPDGGGASDGGGGPDGGNPCSPLGDRLPQGRRNLVFHLPLDEGRGPNVVDRAGGRIGRVQRPEWVAIGAGTGLRFAGNSNIRFPDDAIFRARTLLVEVTIVLESEATWPGTYQHILSKERDFILRFWNGSDPHGSGRGMSTIIFTPSVHGANAHLPDFTYAGALPPECERHEVKFEIGRPTRVSLLYDGVRVMLAIDDRIAAFTRVEQERTTSSLDLFIGSHIDGREGFFGLIDDVKIWELGQVP